MPVPDHLSQGHFLLKSSVTKNRSQSASLFTGSARILLKKIADYYIQKYLDSDILSGICSLVHIWEGKISLHDRKPAELVSLRALLLTLLITRAKSGGSCFPSTFFYQLSQSDFNWNKFYILHAIRSAHPSLQCFISLMHSSLPPPSPLSLPFWIIHMLRDRCSSRDCYSVNNV